MRFLLEMMYYCALSGACGFLEHPAFPIWAMHHSPASTWALTAVRRLRRLNCVSIATLDQCIFHCEGKKPTSLLLVRLPHLREAILKLGRGGRCPHSSRAHPALKGRGADGSFRTSVAKVYPPLMNAAIAEAVIQFACATFVPGDKQEAVPECVATHARMDFVPLSVVQPDYYEGL
jgi:hypothetical protein